MDENEFIKITLSFEHNLFHELSNSVDFENVGKGRLGNHLVKTSDDGIPIVRTTTQYNIPAHDFSSIHNIIANRINDKLDKLPSINFNNALIEIYDSSYTKMKYHSDQCLDLADNSYIGLFSCYENQSELTEQSIRKLKVKDKTTDEEFEVSLTHNSFILFSLSANSKFFHKIILEQVPKQKPLKSENKWLGITFRESKTLIKFKDNLPYFTNGELLELANDEQKKVYFRLRGEENRSIDFIYPKINFTLSKADTIIPKKEGQI
ncbi:alpha-ketoglutarate-dependent dioxygenase AlkB [Maribacter forsetii]|uniref:alpha-ketoglutarate-dependent dioxygenase AlkB n=1 Tax=Maribacter forsetii TaxID=444515 RepID=UPI00055D211F|nr:alpha-ketoglutarate-dependent dioxygenase AlkB [Maribacter forsetii]